MRSCPRPSAALRPCAQQRRLPYALCRHLGLTRRAVRPRVHVWTNWAMTMFARYVIWYAVCDGVGRRVGRVWRGVSVTGYSVRPPGGWRFHRLPVRILACAACMSRQINSTAAFALGRLFPCAVLGWGPLRPKRFLLPGFAVSLSREASAVRLCA